MRCARGPSVPLAKPRRLSIRSNQQLAAGCESQSAAGAAARAGLAGTLPLRNRTLCKPLLTRSPRRPKVRRASLACRTMRRELQSRIASRNRSRTSSRRHRRSPACGLRALPWEMATDTLLMNAARAQIPDKTENELVVKVLLERFVSNSRSA